MHFTFYLKTIIELDVYSLKYHRVQAQNYYFSLKLLLEVVQIFSQVKKKAHINARIFELMRQILSCVKLRFTGWPKVLFFHFISKIK